MMQPKRMILFPSLPVVDEEFIVVVPMERNRTKVMYMRKEQTSSEKRKKTNDQVCIFLSCSLLLKKTHAHTRSLSRSIEKKLRRVLVQSQIIMIVCSLAYSSFSSAYIHHQLFVLPSRFLFSITSFLCVEGIECEKRQRGQEEKGQGPRQRRR